MTKRRKAPAPPLPPAIVEGLAHALARALVSAIQREDPNLGARLAAPPAVEPPAAPVEERVLTTKEVLERVPLDRSTLWRMSREGRFPKPIRLTRSRIGWRWSAILDWLRERETDPIESRNYFGRRGKRRRRQIGDPS